MWPSRITGQWIYSSVLNTSEVVRDFNKVKFGEAKLTLTEYEPNLISGLFDFGDNYTLTLLGT
jgi:hypothetical protein